MTSGSDTEIVRALPMQPGRRHHLRTAALVGAVALIVVGLLGYRLGERAPGPVWHIGNGFATEGGASVEVDGWTYWVPASIRWEGSDGHHEDGRPDCLPSSGAVERLTFLAVPVTADGMSWRSVVFVSCTGH